MPQQSLICFFFVVVGHIIPNLSNLLCVFDVFCKVWQSALCKSFEKVQLNNLDVCHVFFDRLWALCCILWIMSPVSCIFTDLLLINSASLMRLLWRSFLLGVAVDVIEEMLIVWVALGHNRESAGMCNLDATGKMLACVAWMLQGKCWHV